MQIIAIIIIGLVVWHIFRTIRKNIRRGLNRRWDQIDFIVTDGNTFGKKIAENLMNSYPPFPNMKNSEKWASEATRLNFVTGLLLSSKCLEINIGSNSNEISIEGDFSRLDPITKEFLSPSKSISQKELAKGYFVAWELVRSSLEIKGINFTRETSTNMLADQML